MDRSLLESLRRLGAPRLLVLGDIMLNRAPCGDAERVSPVAPRWCSGPTPAGRRRRQPFPLAARLAEFTAGPSEQEGLFFEQRLPCGAPEAPLEPLTEVNFRKLRQRGCHKVRRLLAGD